MSQTDVALRLLQLQKEFNDRQSAEGLASEFQQIDWLPRSEEAIAADYSETLYRFIEG